MLYVFSEKQKKERGSVYVQTRECWFEITDIIMESNLDCFLYNDVEVMFQSDKTHNISDEFPVGEKIGVPLGGGVFIIQTSKELPEEFFDELRKLKDVPRVLLPLIIPKILQTTLGIEIGKEQMLELVKEVIKDVESTNLMNLEKEIVGTNLPVKETVDLGQNVDLLTIVDLPMTKVIREHKKAMKELMKKIDDALDAGNKELFEKLSKQYNRLKAER